MDRWKKSQNDIISTHIFYMYVFKLNFIKIHPYQDI